MERLTRLTRDSLSMMARFPFFAIYLALLLHVPKGTAYSQDVRPENRLVVRVGTGLYDFRRASESVFRQIEFGFTHETSTLEPFAGFISTAKSDGYGYLGVVAGIPILDRVRLLFRFAPGFYRHGNGIDLGFPLEFRSEMELAWSCSSESRLGVGISHLSNGAFADLNPGLEMLSLTYSIIR